MIIAITGKSGSGKTTIAELFAQLGCYHINVDSLCHEALDTMKSELIQMFGKSILKSDGSINRVILGDLIFSSRDKYTLVVQKTWEYASKRIDEIIAAHPLVVIEHILLHQTKYWKLTEWTFLVECKNDEERIQRILARDHISREYLEKRESASPDFSQVHANYTIIT